MFGFVILSHRHPEQLRRLTETISRVYGDPPIACHHDFNQSEIHEPDFPANVSFVRPHVRTAWGKWSLVDATLRALRLLYDRADPDIFLSISAADYPAAGPEKVLKDFADHPADVWIDSLNLHQALRGHVPLGEPELAFHRSPSNIGLGTRMFLKAKVRVPVIRSSRDAGGRLRLRPGRDTYFLPFDAFDSPFRPGYDCWIGSQWFSGRRSAARKLLAPSSDDRKLAKYLSTRPLPDGCYFQTVLCNDPALTWVDRTFRLAFWNGGGAHPADIEAQHMPVILSEQPHFVRKFGPGSPYLDELDRHLMETA